MQYCLACRSPRGCCDIQERWQLHMPGQCHCHHLPSLFYLFIYFLLLFLGFPNSCTAAPTTIVYQENSHKATSRARPWISPEPQKEIKEKRKLHHMFLRTQAQEHWQEYTAQQNRVSSFLRTAKSDFVEQAPTSNLHRLVKHLKSSPKQTIPDLRTDTNIASSSIQKATVLNEFFNRQSQQSVSLEPEDTPTIRW